ncbi:MAG TPA: hypothetical protein ENH53_10245 [Bacteroidetes bacterium]|nr:hypothetical protein [Bacteroidota bacterium]HDZ12588.1 hypothetical protein [Bacteroidota bacterium]
MSGKNGTNSEQGGLFVILLILMTLLLAMVLALGGLLWAHHQSIQRSEAYVKAFYYAQSGVAYCLANQLTSVRNKPIEDGLFSVDVYSLNNQTYKIHSIGFYQQTSRELYVTVKKSNGKYKILDWQDSYINQIINE